MKIKLIKNKADKIEKMTLEEFYASLNPEKKMKIIKLGGKKLQAYQEDDTGFTD